MDEIVEKIRKLLALAESPNENEAALAAEKAQEMMLKHGIDIATVAMEDGIAMSVDDEIHQTRLDVWRRQLATVVANNMEGNVVFQFDPTTNSRRGNMIFYGPSGAVSSIIDLYKYLEHQFVLISATETTNREDKHVHSKTWRRSFLLGMCYRIHDRLEERHRAMTKDAGNALVLARSAIQRKMEENHPGLTTDNRRDEVDRKAYDHGKEKGADVSLGDEQVQRGMQELAR